MQPPFFTVTSEIGDAEPTTKLFTVRDNRLRERNASYEEQNFTRDKFGIKYPQRLSLITEDNMRLRVKQLKIIDSSFFYLRFLSEMTLTLRDGKPRKTVGITELLKPESVKISLARLADQYANRAQRQRFFSALNQTFLQCRIIQSSTKKTSTVFCAITAARICSLTRRAERFCVRIAAIKNKSNAATRRLTERDFHKFLRPDAERFQPLAVNAMQVTCETCGATVTFVPPETARNCDFCGGKIVAQPKSADPLVAPEGVLPFSVTSQIASSQLKSWINSRWFAPSNLKVFAQPDKVGSVYIPYWTFDADSDSEYSGQRGDYYYETEYYEENGKQKSDKFAIRIGTAHRAQFHDISTIYIFRRPNRFCPNMSNN